MPKQGIIYKLCCRDLSIKDIYIGSTANFRLRKCNHKKFCNGINYRNHNMSVYQFIRCNGGWDNWDMVQIEKIDFETRQDLHARERYWIEKLNATLNKIIPTRTPKEYYEENKESIAQKKQEYYEENKEQINQRMKEYNKEYYEANKDRINQKHKEYREDNKEKINQKKKEKITCECGSEVRKSDLRRHERSKKHINFAKQKIINTNI